MASAAAAAAADSKAEVLKQIQERQTEITTLIGNGESREKIEEKVESAVRYIRMINLPKNGSMYKYDDVRSRIYFFLSGRTEYLKKPYSNNLRSLLEAINYEYNQVAYEVLFIKGFSDIYELGLDSKLYDAIRDFDDKETIKELDKIPPGHLRFVGTFNEFLLHTLTSRLLVDSIRHLANSQRVVFSILYNQISKGDEPSLPADVILQLSDRIAKDYDLMKDAIEILDIFKEKDVLRFHDVDSRARILEYHDEIKAKYAQHQATKKAVAEAARKVELERLRTQHTTHRNFSRRSTAFDNGYYIMGHGSDYNDKPTETVPADSAVIAKALPGQTTNVSDINTPVNDTHQSPYNNPFKKRNLLYLIDRYKYLAMFGEGALVPNFSYTLLAYFRKSSTEYRFTYSGITKWPFRTKEKFLDRVELYRKTTVPRDALLRNHVPTIINLYKYSIYPTPEKVMQMLMAIFIINRDITVADFVNAVGDRGDKRIVNLARPLLHVTQAELFTKLPKGVFYNFICRSNKYGHELYERGGIIDESMRDAIAKKNEETIDARKGLQIILAEALGTRAPMTRRRYNNNADAAAASSGSNNAAGSANADTKGKIRHIRREIEEISRSFDKARLYTLIDYLIENVDMFDSDAYHIKFIKEYVGRKMPALVDQLTATADAVDKTAQLYVAFSKINGYKGMFTDYPDNLINYIVTPDKHELYNEASDEKLIATFDSLPLSVLRFIHDPERGYTFLMKLAELGKFLALLHFYNKHPSLVRTTQYNYHTKRLETFYTSIFRFYKRAYPSGAKAANVVQECKKIINRELELGHIDSPILRSELSDPLNVNIAVYKTFEKYIRHYELQNIFGTIQDGMAHFGMMEAAPNSPEEAAAPAAASAKPASGSVSAPAAPAAASAKPAAATPAPPAAAASAPLGVPAAFAVPAPSAKTKRKGRGGRKRATNNKTKKNH